MYDAQAILVTPAPDERGCPGLAAQRPLEVPQRHLVEADVLIGFGEHKELAGVVEPDDGEDDSKPQ